MCIGKYFILSKIAKEVLCRKKNSRDSCRKVSLMLRCNMPSKFSGEDTAVEVRNGRYIIDITEIISLKIIISLAPKLCKIRMHTDIK
jgi:hypothetical protein